MIADFFEKEYIFNDEDSIWTRQNFEGILYSDGDEVEQRIESIVKNTKDLSVLSDELRPHCTDWPSTYHLSATRANILRPFEKNLKGDILEIGAGCGAITRYLGECGAQVLALEGTLRRASIARARTRDLNNVTVVSDKFDDFKYKNKFDIVTLIGVLEYANLFTDGENPVALMLERAKSFLKPNGKLFIAIENQLGLKYFASAPEDHIGIPMYGVEGWYRKDQPQTYGRKHLHYLVEAAGFSSIKFLAPFPDYKLPVSIVTESGFSCDGFDSAALASQSIRKDPQLPKIMAFSTQLVWPSIVDNGLSMDLSNSFLIVAATRENQELVEPNNLAWHFTSERRKKLCKLTKFVKNNNGEIDVFYKRLDRKKENPVIDRLLNNFLPENDQYRVGEILSNDLNRIICKDGWKVEEVSYFLNIWLNYLSQINRKKYQALYLPKQATLFSGELFDYIPQNIIRANDGTLHVIDKEWVFNDKIEIEFLLFRVLWTVIHSVSKFGMPENSQIITYYDFIDHCMKALGWSISYKNIEKCIELEYQIQSEVAGRSIEPTGVMSWLKNNPIPIQNLWQAVRERDTQIQSLNQAVVERDSQNEKLNQAVGERDRQNERLNQAVEERYSQIERLKQSVGERESQIESLTQSVGAHESQIESLTQSVGERESQIERLNQSVGERDSQIESLNQAVVVRDSQNERLNRAVGERDSLNEKLNRAVEERESQIESLTQSVGERDRHIEGLNQAAGERDSQIEGLNQAVGERDSQVERLNQALGQIFNSISWKITKPVRLLGRILRLEFKEAFAFVHHHHFFVVFKNIFLYASKAFRYLARGDIVGVIERTRYFVQKRSKTSIQKKIDSFSPSAVCVVTPGHTNFVAKLIADRFAFHGWTSRITNEMPLEFFDDLYIVICPQIYDKLPPGERLIIYQLEQSVSSRWFNKEYFKILENSLAVLEYSLKNINFLSTKGISYPHINYLPIGATKNYGVDVFPSEEKPEVLFYGDSFSSPRRQKMLDALSEYYEVEIVNDLFGNELISRLRAAKVVINLHYYESGLLEMPRIQECLSLGIHVVSESSQDQNDYPELDGAVVFFEEGSISGMIDAVRMALNSGPLDIEKSVSKSIAKFEFMFDRFLVSMGFLPTSYVNKMQLPLPKGSSIFGLSMPETIARRNMFLDIKPKDCVVFDGIRRKPGWIGCGLSYSALARHAKANNITSITVMEDDVILPINFESKLNSINRFLSLKHGRWDVFSGVIAALHPEVEIIAVEDFEGQRFVTINKMTSMVFNIYAESAIEMFENWNSEDSDAEKNTIDRYLENKKSIKVVATLPFLVVHREEAHSTLWGFQNTTYVEMITNSQALLGKKVAAFLAKQ